MKEPLQGFRAESSSVAASRPIAYMMSRFPEITETFVLFEMLAMERLGRRVELYPLIRQYQDVVHPEARAFIERAHYHAFLSLPVVAANARALATRPGAYFGALFTLLRATWGSLRFFTRGVALFPKAVLFAEEMRAHGIGHIHAHFASNSAAAAFVIHRLTGIPWSFTAHGSDLHRDRHMLREKVAEAAFVATISDYNRELIVSDCGEESRSKVHIVHCGVDTSVFRPRDEDRPVDEPFRVACVGTLYDLKGQTHLIEAVRILRDRRVDIECHFIGDGPDRLELEEQAERHDLGGRVHFHGHCTRDEIAERLRTVDAVSLPSAPTGGRREGIPVALMEAMASGLPVVASNISGIPELVEDGKTGFLVPPRDPQAIADALERLAASPELARQLGKGGRAMVEAEFDVQANAAKLARLIDGTAS